MEIRISLLHYPVIFSKGAVWLKHDHDILDSFNKNEVKDLSTIRGCAFEIAVFAVRVITWSTALLVAFSFTWDRFFTPDFLMQDPETIDFRYLTIHLWCIVPIWELCIRPMEFVVRKVRLARLYYIDEQQEAEK